MATQSSKRLGTAPEEGIKGPVKVATTAQITLSGLQTISSYAVQEGDRVLVKDQTDSTENGIYCASVGQWSRAKDWNQANDVVNGVLVVESNTKVIWAADFTGSFVVGVTEVTFVYTDLAGAAAYLHKAGGNNNMLQDILMGDNFIRSGKVKTAEIIDAEDIINQLYMAEAIDARIAGEDAKDYGRTDMVEGAPVDYGSVTDVATTLLDYGSI